MMKRLLGTCVFAVVLTCASNAGAQGTQFWFDVGRHNTHHENGHDSGGLSWGGGLTTTIGGAASATSGALVVVGFELKSNWGSNFDMVFPGFVAFRIGRNVAFGPGGTFGFNNRSDIDDRLCLVGSLPQQSSCAPRGSEAFGQRDIGGFYGLGLSGFAKVHFGPQARAFAQVLYIHYTPGLTSFLSRSEMNEAFNLFSALGGFDARVDQETESFHPVDYPEFDHGRDVRFSTGYMFGGVNSPQKILRVQYAEKKFDFTRVRANQSGIFNQRTRQLTVGLGFQF